MLYMVTFTINIPQMLAYIPYVDPMGLVNIIEHHFSKPWSCGFFSRRKQKREADSEAMAVPHAALDDPLDPERNAWHGRFCGRCWWFHHVSPCFLLLYSLAN